MKKKIDQFKDYIKNNSFFVDRFKIIKNKYFPKNTLTYNFDNKSLYKNFQFINYEEALSLHKKNSDKDFTLKKNFRSKLIKLKKLINEYDIQPIFITQVMFDGLKDKELFIINNELKDFAKKNNYFLIPLDEMVSMGKNDFYDEVHTTPQGSNKIANQIYSKLSIFLEKNYEINK